MNQKSELVSADTGSLITGLKPSTLRKLAYERRIRSFKVLRCLRFRRSDLEALIVERPARDKRDSAGV